ncbi:MAG: hypothetical protein Q4C13_02665 [Clostridia bacterium]|nr:hypothetical protein [Clostridia bacterium]
MKGFLKENYRMLLLAILSMLAGIAVGACIGIRLPDGGAADTAQAAESIGADTALERVVHFSACAHETSIPMDAAAYLGYTREDMIRHFPDASIMRFDSEEVTLFQLVQGYCPRHYVLRMQDDGTLQVMKTNDSLLTEELIALLPEEPALLHEAERDGLRAGLAFDSLPEIDAYLESMGS